MIEKETALRETLASIGSVVVAYSADRTLGDRALAVTADSASYPERHRMLALQIARDFGLRHEIIHTRELDRPEYRANPSTSTATTPTIVEITARAARRRASSASGVRSTKWI